MTPASRHADGARERILCAAYELFARNGTRSVGIDTIIEKSGVAKMSLYRHFRSKQDLRHAIVVMTVLGPCRGREPYDSRQAGPTAGGIAPGSS